MRGIASILRGFWSVVTFATLELDAKGFELTRKGYRGRLEYGIGPEVASHLSSSARGRFVAGTNKRRFAGAGELPTVAARLAASEPPDRARS